MKNKVLTVRQQDLACRLILFVSAAVFGLVFSLQLSIPAMIDEVGTVSNAAYLSGYDWSQAVYAMGGCYFKAGYALLYYPIVRLINNPYIMYRACLILNVIIGALIPVFCHIILSEHLRIRGFGALIISATSFALPATVLNLLYTKADAVLIFLPWPIITVFLKLESLNDIGNINKNERILYSCILGFLCEYAYFSHTRGIVLIIAVICAIVLNALITKEKTVEPFSFIITIAVFLIIDKMISGYLYKAVFAEYGTNYSSTSSYSFSTLIRIFSKDGIKQFFKEFSGTVFNCIVSSFGTVLIAVIWGITQIISYCTNRDSSKTRYISCIIIILLIFIGTVAMSALYFFPYVYEQLPEYYHRSDWLVYGRYASCSLGPAAMLGTVMLIYSKYSCGFYVKTAAFILYVIIAVLFILCVVPDMEGVQAVARNFITLCTFLRLNSYGQTSAVYENLQTTFTLAAALGLFIFIILLIFLRINKSIRRKITIVPLLIVLTASISVSIINYEKIRVSRDNVLNERTSEVYTLLSSLEEKYHSIPVIVDSSAMDIKHYQFLLNDYVLGNRFTENILSEEYFIIAKKEYFVRDFYDDDYYIFDSFDYENAVKDIVYVKGDKLYKKLSGSGISLTKYQGSLRRSPVSNSGV